MSDFYETLFNLKEGKKGAFYTDDEGRVRFTGGPGSGGGGSGSGGGGVGSSGKYPKWSDDGAGASLFEYPKGDVMHDYVGMRSVFGEDDPDVQRYKRVLDSWDEYIEKQ